MRRAPHAESAVVMLADEIEITLADAHNAGGALQQQRRSRRALTRRSRQKGALLASVTSPRGSGAGYGLPFDPWLHVTVSFGAHTWENSLPSAYLNSQTAADIADGFLTMPGPGAPPAYEDFYAPFAVSECADVGCADAFRYHW